MAKHLAFNPERHQPFAVQLFAPSLFGVEVVLSTAPREHFPGSGNGQPLGIRFVGFNTHEYLYFAPQVYFISLVQ